MESSARIEHSLYLQEHGARLVRVYGDSRIVYAVREDLGIYVGLPAKWWISHLGFSACIDVTLVQPAYMESIVDQGVIMLEV